MKQRAIPSHLKHYMARQDYEKYTAIDHASWRFIMRVSRAFFKDHAHAKYLTGLKETGITVERIPRMIEMDRKLRKFGWKVATVTGFIPPSIFLEFLSLSILPIACDMRRLEHLDYTPAPDIVHEAAGHAPIISDRKFASYLNRFGEIARKAIFAKEDLDVYEAIKELSEIKESAKATPESIGEAEKNLQRALGSVSYTSEATKLARLGWWSTEYGLIQRRNAPKNGYSWAAQSKKFKIYGAGLLSSVGESYNCFSAEVIKRPLTIECVNVNYDITKPQPQLFYVNDFKELENVIDELSLQLAFRLGGIEGLARAKRSGLVNTVELDTGVQISGRLTAVYGQRRGERGGVYEIGEPWQKGIDTAFAEFNGVRAERLNQKVEHKFGPPVYLQFSGPVQLSHGDRQLRGQSARYHAAGYGTPIGKIKRLNKCASELTRQDFLRLGFKNGGRGVIEFESGVRVEGILKNKYRMNGRNLVLTFAECRVYRPADTQQDELVFFRPEWGVFDLACGEKVTSVFSGAADRGRYLRDTSENRPQIRAQNSTWKSEDRNLIPLYARVRAIRERGAPISKRTEAEIQMVTKKLSESYKDDWLLRLELLELVEMMGREGAADQFFRGVRARLEVELAAIGSKNKTVRILIRRGQELISS